ncbi:MAG TPA: DUF2259 domain-containing protein [Rhizobiaceae bacterium]|nr:DUF2259 domain-containing protein [Rhizobiaceae bacterium]
MRWREKILAAVGLLFVLALPSKAGDTASVEVLGFSRDGGVFAFEEYGIQDGSGFPYAHRFYIDTATDKFLANTPIRVTLEDENATLEQARGRAKTRGEKIIQDSSLARNKGYTAGFNAVTESSADPFRMAVNPRAVFPPIDAPLEFRLEERDVAPPERCEGLGDVKGFRLLKIRPVPNGKVELRYEDKTIPLSRGCPTGYRLSGIQTLFPRSGDDKAVYAVLIGVERWGFEGPDFRWIAITGRF